MDQQYHLLPQEEGLLDLPCETAESDVSHNMQRTGGMHVFIVHLLLLFSMLLLAVNYLGVRLFIFNGSTGFMFGFLRSLLSLAAIPVLNLGTQPAQDSPSEPLFSRRTTIIPILMVVICGALRQMALPISLMWNSVSSVGIIQPATPAFTTLFSILFGVEKCSFIPILSVCICCLGLYLAEEGWKTNLIGNGIWLLFFLPISKGLQLVGIQLLPQLSASVVQILQIVGLSVFSIPIFFLVQLEVYSNGQLATFWGNIVHLTVMQWSCVIYSVVAVIIISWRIQIWGIKAIGSIAVSLYQCAQPVFAFLLSFFFLNESIKAVKVIGSIIVCISLFLNQFGQYYEKRRHEHLAASGNAAHNGLNHASNSPKAPLLPLDENKNVSNIL